MVLYHTFLLVLFEYGGVCGRTNTVMWLSRHYKMLYVRAGEQPNTIQLRLYHCLRAVKNDSITLVSVLASSQKRFDDACIFSCVYRS